MPKGIHSWLCFDQTNTFRADIWSARDQFTQVSFSCPLRFFLNFFLHFVNSTFFPYCPELPKRPKQKNSCSKMWLTDQLYIELGWQCSPSSKKGRRKIVSLLLHVTLLHAQWGQNKFSNFRPKPFWSSIMIFTTFYLPMWICKRLII